MPTLTDNTNIKKGIYSYNEDVDFDGDNNKIKEQFTTFASKEKDRTALGYCDLLIYLKAWGASSKCFNLIDKNEKSNKSSTFKFFLNATRHGKVKNKKKEKDASTAHKDNIVNFFSTIFPKENDLASIKKCVAYYTTFFIEIKQTTNKKSKQGDIIAAINFVYDENKENAYISWLGALNHIPKKYKNTYVESFGDSFQSNGFCSFLITTMIKHCKVTNSESTHLWLQVSNEARNAKAFYESKGFYYKGKRLDEVPLSIRKKINKFCWVNEQHMLLYKCDNNRFGAEDIPDIPITTENTTINESLYKSKETARKPVVNPIKGTSDNLNKGTSDTPDDNDYTKITCPVDLKEERREEIAELIKGMDPTFDIEKYAKSSGMDDKRRLDHPNLYFAKTKIKDKVYASFPPPNYLVAKYGALNPDTIKKLLEFYPLLRQYMKCNDPSLPLTIKDLKPSFITNDWRIHLCETCWLPWELLQMLLNIFIGYGGFDNVAIIPAYTSTLCKLFREAKNKEGKNFFDHAERYKAYKTVVGSIPASTRKGLLHKRLIVYVHCIRSNHWICIFLFNLGEYIRRWEDNKKSRKPTNSSTLNGSVCGYHFYDPFDAGLKCEVPGGFSTGIVDFLNIIYDHCWQRNKPFTERYGETPFTYDFFKKPLDPSNPFYSMRTESLCCPIQYDGYNCGIGLTFAIMRFARAFHNNDVLSDWISYKDGKECVIIPSRVFYSMQYSLSYEHHLKYLRAEVINFTDGLSEILSTKYDYPTKQSYLKTQLVSKMLNVEHINTVFMDHTELQYVDEDYGDTLIGMTEHLECKQAFHLLDQYDHRFLNVKGGKNMLFHYFGIILREKGLSSFVSSSSEETIDLVKYELHQKIKSQDFRKVKDQFLNDEMAEHPTLKALLKKSLNLSIEPTDEKCRFFISMCATQNDIDDITSFLENKARKFTDKEMILHQRFLVRLFAFRYNINVPYLEVIPKKDEGREYYFFVAQKDGKFPKQASFTSKVYNEYLNSDRLILIKHKRYDYGGNNEMHLQDTNSLKLLVVNERKEGNLIEKAVKKRGETKATRERLPAYYLGNINLSHAEIVEHPSITKQNTKEEQHILSNIKNFDSYNAKIVPLINDGNDVIYSCYTILKLKRVDIENDPKIFVPEIRQSLYNYFLETMKKEIREKLFKNMPTIPESDTNDGKDTESPVVASFFETLNADQLSILRRMRYTEDEMKTRLLEVWNMDITYINESPRKDYVKSNGKYIEKYQSDSIFTLKLFAMQYKINVPILNIQSSFNGKKKNKTLIVINENGLETKIDCFETHDLSAMGKLDFIVVIFNRLIYKNRKFGTTGSKHHKVIWFDKKITLKQLIGLPRKVESRDERIVKNDGSIAFKKHFTVVPEPYDHLEEFKNMDKVTQTWTSSTKIYNNKSVIIPSNETDLGNNNTNIKKLEKKEGEPNVITQVMESQPGNDGSQDVQINNDRKIQDQGMGANDAPQDVQNNKDRKTKDQGMRSQSGNDDAQDVQKNNDSKTKDQVNKSQSGNENPQIAQNNDDHKTKDQKVDPQYGNDEFPDDSGDTRKQKSSNSMKLNAPIATKGKAQMMVNLEKPKLSSDDSDSTSSEYSDDHEINFQCCAYQLCKKFKHNIKNSNWLTKDDKSEKCYICNHFAHKDCTIRVLIRKKKLRYVHIATLTRTTIEIHLLHRSTTIMSLMTLRLVL